MIGGNLLQVILWVIILGTVAIVGYIVTVVASFGFNFLKTRKSLPNLPRTSNPPSEVPLFKLFEPDATRKFLHEFVDENGTLRNKIVFLGPHLDGKPLIAVGDGEEFRELFREEKFPKLKLVYQTFDWIMGTGLLLAEGEHWKRQRKLLTPLFHFKNLVKMPEIMTNRISEFCDEMAALKGEEILPGRVFGTLTLRIVVDCVFGGKEFVDADKMSPHWDDLNQAFNAYFFTSIFFGSKVNKKLPFPWNLSLMKATNQIRSMVRDAIARKREILKRNEINPEDQDLLTALLTVRDETTGEGIPDESIIDEALTFLFAGHDTTSSTLSWCMTFFSRLPDVVEKIREEVDRVVGAGNIPSHGDIQHLSYTTMVVKETLRMRPPVPMLDRYVLHDSVICGEQIPASTYLNPVIIAAHFDNRYWKDPFTFRPERFDSNNHSEPERPSYVYVPFSANTRNCIGQKFALMEAVLAVAMIAVRFDVRSNTKPEEDCWAFEGTMKPTKFKCSFHERKC